MAGVTPLNSGTFGLPQFSARGPASPSTGGQKRLSIASRSQFRDAASLLNESMASAPAEENVKVLCRVRPFNAREEQLHQQSIEGKPQWERMPLRSVVEFRGNTCVMYDSTEWTERERFTFDGCLWSIPSTVQDSDNEFVSQETLFDLYGRDLLSEVWRGFNTCFFAYGQTGSGKTYSMMGDPANPGFIPRMCQCLFDQIEEVLLAAEQDGADNMVRQFRVEVRYMEIYNEMVKDLLWPLSPLSAEMKAKLNPENLRIRSTPQTGVFVEGLTGVEVDSWGKMLELIETGNVGRSVASTKMNERSSRSHAIFKITLSQITTSVPKKQFEKPTQHLKSAQINLVDLAGSERNKKTGATGDRLKEAASINRSLMCLKQVIDALVDNSQITKAASKKRVPYRDSHLTSILMDSLGGNAKTWMLVCISPHADNAEESQQTLRYGSRARKIVNVVHVNENASARLMMDLEDELERLKAELATSTEAVPEALETIRAQIEAHESAIHTIEKEVESRQSNIAALEREHDKRAKERQAGALANLSTVMQARLKRDAVEGELQQKMDVYAALQEQLRQTQANAASLEADTAKSTEEARKLRATAAQMDRTIDDLKKKTAKLELQRRTLQKSCEEGEQLTKSLARERFASILKARLEVARYHIAYRAKVEDTELSSGRKMESLREEAAGHDRELDIALQAQLTQKHHRITQLKAEVQAVRTEDERQTAERTAQVSTLQQEVAHLQQELRRKREAHQQKLQQLSGDWEKKQSVLLQEMERQHQALAADWGQKRRALQQQYEAQKAAIVTQYQEECARVSRESDAQLTEATEKGVAECTRLKEQWEGVLAVKRERNEALREQLKEVARENQKHWELHRRIAAAIDIFQKIRDAPPKKFTQEAVDYANSALEFYAIFEDQHADRVNLDHLLKANLTLARCSVAPVLGEGEGGAGVRAKSPAARCHSPAMSARASGSAVGSHFHGGGGSQSRSMPRGDSIASVASNGSGVHSSVPRVLRSVSPRIGTPGGGMS